MPSWPVRMPTPCREASLRRWVSAASGASEDRAAEVSLGATWPESPTAAMLDIRRGPSPVHSERRIASWIRRSLRASGGPLPFAVALPDVLAHPW